jgi:hypothetical protein
MMIQHYILCGFRQLQLVIVFDICILHIYIIFLRSRLLDIFLITLIVFFIFLVTLRFLLMIKLHYAHLTSAHQGIRVLNHV